jgi:hypothetical protein
MFGAFGIGNDPIQLPQFQRSGILFVSDAHYELWFRALHSIGSGYHRRSQRKELSGRPISGIRQAETRFVLDLVFDSCDKYYFEGLKRNRAVDRNCRVINILAVSRLKS